MHNQSEIDAKLDEIIGDQASEKPGEKPGEKPSGDQTGKKSADEKPPGYMTHEEWIAAGRDEADYRGQNAYTKEYERIQDNKELKGMVKSILTDQKATKEAARKEGYKQATEELEAARKEEDVEAALAAKDKLNRLDVEASGDMSTQQMHPKVAELIVAHPMLDMTHDDYNKDFAADFENIYDGWLIKLSRNKTIQVTDAQIEKAWNRSVADAKELNPELFESGKRKQQTAVSTNRKPDSGQVLSKLKTYKIHARNPDNENAAQDMSDYLEKEYPKAFNKTEFAQKVMGDDSG